MDSSEITKIVKQEIDTLLADFIRKFWYVVMGMVLTSATAWYSLYYHVQQLDLESESNMSYTKEKIAENQKQIDTLRTDYKSDIQEIKEDIKYIRNKF